MLPSELLVAVFSRNGNVFVKYAKHDCYAAASDLINIFSQSSGKKRKYLNASLDNYLEQHFDVDARRVRGLFELLMRRSTFSSTFSPEEIPPLEIRKKVFEHAKHTSNEEERNAAIEAIAKELGITADYLLSRMFADMEDEQIITQFDAIDAKTLIKLYNLSLVQTLLFRATEMEFSVDANAREVFSAMKRLGLMYHAYQTDRLYVKVDGPMSVLKLTEKYGTSFAKLLPAIVKPDDFNLKAFIVRRKNDVRQYILNLDSRHKWFFSEVPSPYPSPAPTQAHEHETETGKKDNYDSRVEERFATAFKSLDIGWTLRREPCALITKAGTGVIIPDFVFEKGDLKVYMEIVGFWTENYLKKKFEKLNAVKDRIIVAVDETLVCSRLKEKENMNLIYFKNKIPMNKIVKILKEYEDSAVQEELKRLDIEQMNTGDIDVEKLKVINGDVVTVETVAKQFNISPEAARIMEFKGYRLLGDEFISLEKIQRIKGKLGEQTTYSKACEIIKGEGIKCAVGVLQALNYKVKWKNLEEMEASVSL
jgi:predicted nuclease of restriction endonuclease-like RecB superfamily